MNHSTVYTQITSKIGFLSASKPRKLSCGYKTHFSDCLGICSRHIAETIWEKTLSSPFDELIVSWNARRPSSGSYLLSVSIKMESWSEWFPYAEWGSMNQKTFQYQSRNLRSYQDVIALVKEATGFRIKVTASGGATLSHFHALHACTSRLKDFTARRDFVSLNSVVIPTPFVQSQFALNHPRNKDFCSPVSTSMAINQLQNNRIDPLQFAQNVHDQEFDIYGNWVLNVAESYEQLGGLYECRVERLKDFSALHALLARSLPVVCSVKGPLAEAPLPFLGGHLLLVVGWDSLQQRVLCADPAYIEPQKVLTSYPINDFLAAWERRHHLTYVFTPKQPQKLALYPNNLKNRFGGRVKTDFSGCLGITQLKTQFLKLFGCKPEHGS